MKNIKNNTTKNVSFLNDDQLFVNENSIVTFAFDGEDVAQYFPLGFENEDLDLAMGNVNKFNTLGLEDYKNIYIIGLGENTQNFDLNLFRTKIRPFLTSLQENVNFDLISTIFCDKKELAQLLTEEFIELKYEFSKISEKVNEKNEVEIFLASDIDLTDVIASSKIKAQSTNITKNFVNLPSNYLVPQTYVEMLLSLIKDENINVNVFNTQEIEKNNFGLIKAVNSGSSNEAYVICLELNNNKNSQNYKTIVGKGITYDTGGMSLKTSAGLISMKGDMAGSATALSVIYALSKLNAQINLRVILGISENSLSACSYKVDSVLISKSKKTVEVKNTDAEGRLVLADLITYAQEFTTDEIISLSTLTGSNANYFGSNITPIHTTNIDIAQKISQQANLVNQFSWVMPLNQFGNIYKEQLTSSPVADLTNIGNGNDGIIAGVFLNEFIESEKTNFIHIDIAGTSFNKTSTGVMVKPLINYLLKTQ